MQFVTLSKLKCAMWLLAGIVASQVIVQLIGYQLAISPGMTMAGVMIRAFLVSALIGVVLCGGRSERMCWLMGLCVSLYEPAILTSYWIMAFLVDLFSYRQVPGPAVEAVSSIQFHLSPALLTIFIGMTFAVIGIFVTALRSQRH